MIRFIAAFATLLLAACDSTSQAEDIDAVMVNPDTFARADLTDVLASALGNRDIMIPEDALTTQSVISITRKQHRTMEGRIDGGRVTEMPEKFRLIKSGESCILVHENSGVRYTLPSVDCEPI